MFGGHLPDTPPETLGLLQNADVLRLLSSTGSREIVRDGSLVIWRADFPDHEVCAVFWLGDESEEVTVHLSDVGSASRAQAHDLWAGDEVPLHDGSVRLTVPAHGTRLLRLS
jgi:alpha-galactosidase